MSTTPTATPSAPSSASPQNRSKTRRTALLALGSVFTLAALAYGVYWYLYDSHYESTDNAYVQGNVVQVTPQIAGTVVAINAQDTDYVKAGQTLISLDPADAQVALEQAQAQLAQTVREVRTLYANNATLGASIAAREAEVARSIADMARAQDDVSRRTPLLATGAVSSEELDHARAAVTTANASRQAAQAALVAARESLGSSLSLTDGVPVEQHPNVLRAAARVREAFLATQRAALVAPVSGLVARRSVQVGQRIAPGVPLLAVVPLDQLWVDANFKEVQLRNMRIGQRVTLDADVYGGKVIFHGKVVGLGAGTGSAFALLPAQNATGNWIKVVQRVPVRIALDAAELAAHPLRIGLSMQAEVDVADQSGKALADANSTANVTTTDVFTQSSQDADALVHRIVTANLGRKAVLTAKPGAAARAAGA